MNLQALYDLKERLEHAAIAGTGLLQEDFRLKRSVEALAPLAAASPVFAKIAAATQSLLAAPAEERGRKLLDVLSLINAVVYTQGTVTVPGELQPLEIQGGAYVQASYGQLQPLLAALGGTGSGRMAQIKRYWEDHPEYFRDFRVLPYVIRTLGDPYGELCDLIAHILQSMGSDVLPLLKEGFDGKGKREMVRRVQLIEAVAGAQENDFYLSELEGSEKEVRGALIYALRHEESNAQKLVELCQTERSGPKKSAHWALAKLESDIAWEYWETLAQKDLKQAASYMILSTARRAGVLVAKALDQVLTDIVTLSHGGLKREDVDRLQELLYALPGKTGMEICEVYRRMAALGTSLDSVGYTAANGQSVALRLRGAEDWKEDLRFSHVVPIMLQRSILFNPAPELMALAKKLSRKHVLYHVPTVTTAMITGTAEEAFDAAEPWLRTVGLVLRKRPKESIAVLSRALQDIGWSQDAGGLVFRAAFTDPASGSVMVERPIKEHLDPRWYQYLTAPGGDEVMDSYLFCLMDPTDGTLKAQLGQYFYKRALAVNDNSNYLYWLRTCGWSDCSGLLENYCKHNKVSTWSFMQQMEQLPGGAAQKIAEAERVLKLIETKKVQVGTWNPTQIERRLELLRSQAHSEQG